MGKHNDPIMDAIHAASRQPQLQVATPQTWEQLVAWTAAIVYPHTRDHDHTSSPERAVDVAVAIVARSAGAVKSGVLQRAAQAEMARLEQEQADQGNPSTAQN